VSEGIDPVLTGIYIQLEKRFKCEEEEVEEVTFSFTRSAWRRREADVVERKDKLVRSEESDRSANRKKANDKKCANRSW